MQQVEPLAVRRGGGGGVVEELLGQVDAGGVGVAAAGQLGRVPGEGAAQVEDRVMGLQGEAGGEEGDVASGGGAVVAAVALQVAGAAVVADPPRVTVGR
ncbi:hypothetical protein PV435_06105, partial [Streptomyces scabiei]|nr:hypothetical protein [Streptomyces scabiei]